MEGQPVKAGYQTTEFWLYVAAAVVGALAASGVFDCDPAVCADGSCYCPAWVPMVSKMLGVLATIAAALGYGKNRSVVKLSASAGAPKDPT